MFVCKHSPLKLKYVINKETNNFIERTGLEKMVRAFKNRILVPRFILQMAIFKQLSSTSTTTSFSTLLNGTLTTNESSLPLKIKAPCLSTGPFPLSKSLKSRRFSSSSPESLAIQRNCTSSTLPRRDWNQTTSSA